ncbi:30S ribosomal protein S24e [Ignicoccus islandicus]|uniref:30S ribosomal protein S24e n=1 Tax=Ignicoccus islandicus TaxID=54259 RepID=UPI00094678B1|nr:hypothetical protein [Ignicoccus islandicus]
MQEIVSENFTIHVVEDRYNPLIERRELSIVIHHVGKSTPKRCEVKEAIAKSLGIDPNLVIVRKLVTEYGIGRTRGKVHIYNNQKRLEEIEPQKAIKQNQCG